MVERIKEESHFPALKSREFVFLIGTKLWKSSLVNYT